VTDSPPKLKYIPKLIKEYNGEIEGHYQDYIKMKKNDPEAKGYEKGVVLNKRLQQLKDKTEFSPSDCTVLATGIQSWDAEVEKYKPYMTKWYYFGIGHLGYSSQKRFVKKTKEEIKSVCRK
jgi:hypothetical protein